MKEIEQLENEECIGGMYDIQLIQNNVVAVVITSFLIKVLWGVFAA